jgi:carbonic anhydrase
MAHQAKLAVIICMDFRFQTVLRHFLVHQGFQDQYDLISLAGAAKTLTQSPEKGIVLHQLQVSFQLHHIKQVLIINHQDCGAYGPKLAENPVKELAVHKHDLLQAQKTIQKHWPNLKVQLYFLTLKKEFIKI